MTNKTNQPKKIAIDARLYGLKHAGIGRYIQNLISQLSLLDTQNHYTIITNTQTQILDLPRHAKVIKTDIRHYSLMEQISMARLINNLDLDLVHFPHFNVPVMTKHPYVVTIHDLLWHDKIGFDVTTLSAPTYMVKYLGYRLVISRAIRNSAKIITPADQVKQTVQRRFSQHHSKVFVTHEAADELYHQPATLDMDLDQYGLRSPFVIYTGSLYPHKNVISVVRALKRLNNLSLAIVSARNVFADKFWQQVKDESMDKRVQMLGFVEDVSLRSLYDQAVCLVQPSQSEGFGLTGLEAMAAGLPVLCSQNSVMSEIYSKAALFVDTMDIDQLADALDRLSQEKDLRDRLSQAGIKRAKKFSWEKMAKQTLEIYKKV